MANFEELGINATLRRAIDELGFVMPMPVQEAVIPQLLATLSARENSREAAPDDTDSSTAPTDGTSQECGTEAPGTETSSAAAATPDTTPHDIIALAQTGTGKTAAFGLPLLQALDLSRRETQAVIMSPTRELCLQISDDLRDFGKYMDGLRITAVYGGAPIDSQIRQLRKGTHVIVATPGRLVDLTERGVADISTASTIVLDEADEMLNMGFSESIDAILAGVPAERNTLLFSATMGKEIERIAKSYLKDYKEIVVGSRNEGAEHVNHIYYLVHARDKYLALKRIVDYYPRIYAIVFCRTRMETQEIADLLIRDGYNAEALHGDLSQAQRDLTMQKFRQHRTQLLVATDVAARGLDVEDLTHVINYGLPDDVENYTHRSGRTGRAGKRGTSISIIHLREKGKVRIIEKVIQKKFEAATLPEPKEICTKQLYRVIDEIERIEVDETEIAPFLPEVFRKLEWLSKEDVVKRIVSREFGHFLKYYADAPEIMQPSERRERDDKTREEKPRRERGGERAERRGPQGGPRKAEPGYKRLFINLGKRDNFYAREIINLVNRHVKGAKVDIGRIDLTTNCSFFEVPEADAMRVLQKMKRVKVGERKVVVDWADPEDEGDFAPRNTERPKRKSKKAARREQIEAEFANDRKRHSRDDWKQFFE
ncbi:MAG: DEAD/DEAH box helicase [Bacteroidales bacterium]|nr:DEAD/DEAH box helicase [Bacteroidales bacterium]